MTGLWTIAEGVSAAARGAIPREERLRALRNVPGAGVDAAWLWAAAAVAAGAAVAAAVWIYLARRHARIEAAWERFAERGAEAGLNDAERGLLGRIARLAGLGARPDAIFTAEQAFATGLARLAGGAARCGGPCATCTYLVSLREKLGFQPPAPADRPNAVTLGHLEPGTTLRVFRQTKPEHLQVFVTAHRAEGRELLVLPEVPLEARVGETWTVRYPQGGQLWEFDAQVLGALADEIVIRPRSEARWLNRRRFARVATRAAAHVARFPFHKGTGDAGAPEVVSARLVEIGGPGLRVEAALEAEVGDRMLVVTRLPNRVMETVGAVRHVRPGARGGRWQIAMELTGLDTAQIAELTQITNELAPRREPERDQAQAEGAYAGESAHG